MLVWESSRKRKRLSTACTRCRSRKVRCDDKQPACTNCEKAGLDGVTWDARQPYIEVERREAQSLNPSVATPATAARQSILSSPTHFQQTPVAANQQEGERHLSTQLDPSCSDGHVQLQRQQSVFGATPRVAQIHLGKLSVYAHAMARPCLCSFGNGLSGFQGPMEHTH
jgi:hypothetical protein